jgi:hypothetical protein
LEADESSGGDEESSGEDEEIVSDDEQSSDSESGSDRRRFPAVDLDGWLLQSLLNPALFAADGERPRWLPEQIRTGSLTRRERAVIDRGVRGILRLGGDPLDFVWLFRTLLPGRFNPLDGEIAEAVVRADIEPGESSLQTTSGTSLPGHRFQLLEALARQALYERVALFHPVELEARGVQPTGVTLRAFEAAVEEAVGGEPQGEDGRLRCSDRKSIVRGMVQMPKEYRADRAVAERPTTGVDFWSAMQAGGLINAGHKICHFIAVVEVLINHPLMREALERCGEHPVIEALRGLAKPRRVGASALTLIKALYVDVPQSIWRDCAWFDRGRDAGRTFVKLVTTFEWLPNAAGKPLADLLGGVCRLNRRCVNCGAALNEPGVDLKSIVPILSPHHSGQWAKLSPEQWIGEVRRCDVRACAACGVAGPSRLAMETSPTQPVFVVHVEGPDGSIMIPDTIPLGAGFRLEAVVECVGARHAIARIREPGGGDRWRDFDDLTVTDTRMGFEWGDMREGPFELAVYIASPDASGAHPMADAHGGL